MVPISGMDGRAICCWLRFIFDCFVCLLELNCIVVVVGNEKRVWCWNAKECVPGVVS